jgi:CHAT domain-containing protein/Flp pilus assembly protein TadD
MSRLPARILTLLLLSAIALVLFPPGRRVSRRASNWTVLAQAQPTIAAGRDVRPLTASERLEREVTADAVHSYDVTLSLDQYLHVTIEQLGLPVGGAVYAPDGRLLFEFHCREHGPTPVSLIANAAGTYRLEVRGLEKGQNAAYVLQADSVRPAVAKDKTCIEAETAFAAGEVLINLWSADSTRKAIGKYEAALASWNSATQRHEAVNAYLAIGDAWHSLTELQKALHYYSLGLSLSRKVKAGTARSELLNAIGYVHLYSGKNQQALGYFSEALKLSKASNDRWSEATALNNIGETYYALRRQSDSFNYYRQALSLWEQQKNRSGQALALLNFGYSYSDLSDTENALASYNRALSLWHVSGNRRGEAATLTALGHLYSKLGEKQKALNFYDQATQLIQPLDDKAGQAFIFNGMGYVYEELGNQQDALRHYQQALQLFRSMNYREGEAGSLYKLGKVSFALGNTSEALGYYEQSRAVSHAIGDSRMEAVPLGLMGQVYVSLRQEKQALQFYHRALLLNRIGKDRREEAYTLNSIGKIYESLGTKQEALGYYNQALSLNRATGDRFGESFTLYGIACVNRKHGDLTAARAKLEAAITLAESLRTDVNSGDLRASYFATVRQHYESYIDVLMQLHNQHPEQGLNAEALQVSERARARSLLESLKEAGADLRQTADPVLLEKERSLEQQLSSKDERHTALLAENKQEEAKLLDQEINQLTEQYKEVRGRLKTSSPHYAALTQAQPLTPAEIQQQILRDDSSLLLEYMLGDERSYLWVVTRTEVSSYELPGRAEIEKEARSLYTLLTASQPLPGETFEQTQARLTKANEQLPAQIAKLSRILLWPVASKLGTKRLLVVPDGALQYIPFQILTAPASPGGSESISAAAESRPLVLDHEIVNEPSASALALLINETASRQPAADAVAVFADPVFESDDPRIHFAAGRPTDATAKLQENESQRALRDVGLSGNGRRIPRLQSSRDEADAIMSAAPWWSGRKSIGFAASRAAVMSSNLGRYRIIHFATHGLLNDEHPELSGIVLSLFDEKGEPQDGFLRLYDIYNLKLPVDLVVLSACNTGLGKDVRGEGLIGLTRGFMYAGASSVVASLWKVDDEATAELMRYFYGFMLKDGLTPAAALRKAQVTMSQQKRWRSPYFWSGFIIQGQYNQSETTRRFHYARWSFVVGGLVLLSLAAFFIRKRRRITVV